MIPPLARYLVLQIPGWLAIILGGALLVHVQVASWALVGGVLGVWVVKDLALYPFLRPHLFARQRAPLDDLLGRRATVTTPLTPEGYVQLGNERWRAVTEDRAALEVGRAVRVVGTDGSTMIVAPDETAPSGPGSG